MDPWGVILQSPQEKSLTNSLILSFEDDFKPLVSDTLPDSKEYLEILESKLRKLKSDPNILRQLVEKREACMQQLLSDITVRTAEDDCLEEPTQNSAILRTFAPEKQALTQGEKVDFVNYDQLINDSRNSSESEVE